VNMSTATNRATLPLVVFDMDGIISTAQVTHGA
jgi:hypothetical protein